MKKLKILFASFEALFVAFGIQAALTKTNGSYCRTTFINQDYHFTSGWPLIVMAGWVVTFKPSCAV